MILSYDEGTQPFYYINPVPKSTWQFSPGCCDWDIGQQKMVFRAVGRDSTGVQLTEWCLMIPGKSISGIIGIGLCNDNVEHYNLCKSCDKHDCQGRREL